MQSWKAAVSTATLATIIVTIIIVVAIGATASITFLKSGQTSITCSETTSTFTVIEGGNTSSVGYPIPAQPCQHSISLTGFTLTESGTISGNITINSRTFVNGLILYFNGTYDTYAAIETTVRSIHYSTQLNNYTLAIGQTYTLEIVGLFKDGTASTANTTITVTA